MPNISLLLVLSVMESVSKQTDSAFSFDKQQQVFRISIIINIVFPINSFCGLLHNPTLWSLYRMTRFSESDYHNNHLSIDTMSCYLLTIIYPDHNDQDV